MSWSVAGLGQFFSGRGDEHRPKSGERLRRDPKRQSGPSAREGRWGLAAHVRGILVEEAGGQSRPAMGVQGCPGVVTCSVCGFGRVVLVGELSRPTEEAAPGYWLVGEGGRAFVPAYTFTEAGVRHSTGESAKPSSWLLRDRCCGFGVI